SQQGLRGFRVVAISSHHRPAVHTADSGQRRRTKTGTEHTSQNERTDARTRKPKQKQEEKAKRPTATLFSFRAEHARQAHPKQKPTLCGRNRAETQTQDSGQRRRTKTGTEHTSQNERTDARTR